MRSWLFVPANAERRIYKAVNSRADAVIIDLEDSVPPEEKNFARVMAARLACELQKRRPGLYMRCNSRDETWFAEDVSSAIEAGFAGIVLPKSGCREDVLAADELLNSAGARADGMEIMPLIETARGVLNAREIASCCARVKRVCFGLLDFLLDMGGIQTPEGHEADFPRAYISLASVAAGLEGPVDTVYSDYNNLEGLRADSEKARAIGYSGKLLIHPAQIETVNAVFSPSREEIDAAKEIKNRFELALAEGRAAIKLNGKMVDMPVYLRAKRTLELASEYGLVEDVI